MISDFTAPLLSRREAPPWEASSRPAFGRPPCLGGAVKWEKICPSSRTTASIVRLLPLITSMIAPIVPNLFV